MNPRTIIAIVLICVGVLGLGYQGITWTTRERVVEVGSLHIDADKSHNLPIAPVVGVVALVGGLAILFMGRGTKI